MYQFFEYMIYLMDSFIKFYQSFSFEIGGMTINYFSLILGFLVTGFVISVFWKGART